MAVAGLCLSSCSNFPSHPGDPEAATLLAAFFTSQISTFTISATENNLSQDYPATIGGDVISLSIPYGKASSAIPTFTGIATQYYANGVALTSGVTPVDLTAVTTITAVSPLGFRRNYTLSTYQIAPVADTGQTNCYAGAGLSSCAATSASDPNQDAHFATTPNARAFGPSSVNPLYPSDPITIDRLKGLIWKSCQEGFTGPTCAAGALSAVTYAGAVTACTSLNSANAGAGYAGLKKWRLPTFQELNQVQEHNLGGHVYWNTTYFPNAPVTTGVNLYRWTSSRVLPALTNTMAINELHQQQSTATTNPTHCVNGDNPPADELVDNGDGTILNLRTRLVWQKCSMGQTNDSSCSGTLSTSNWTSALLYCKNLTLAGRTWRLPNITELITLMDMSRPSPFLNSTYFPNLSVASFHSSTTLMQNPIYNWILDISNASVGGISGKGNPYNAKCVSGP